MFVIPRRILTKALPVLTLVLMAVASSAQTATNLFSTPEEIKTDLMTAPCQNKERLQAARALFEKWGAGPTDLVIQKNNGSENLVVTRVGTEPGKIVVGAHYDFIDAGCGAIDNWTGVVALAHVFRSAAKLGLKKTVIYVAFGNEEKGLLGSHAMARAIPKAEVSQYCAMINMDSFGMGAPFALRTVSTDSLTKLTEQKAGLLNIPFYTADITDADTDSSSFMERKIPAVTLSGLTNQWRNVLHSSRDQLSAVNGTSVYVGYRLALSVLEEIDRNTCDTYRGKATRN